MIKTRTRSFFVSLLLLMSLLGFGQGIGSPSGGSPGVCPGTSVTLNQALTSPLDYAYEYWDGEGWVCCFGNNQLPYNFSVPSTGQLIEIRRKYTDGATIVKTESLGTFYSPVTPVIGTTVGVPCNQNDGSITVSDHSNNYGAMPRTFQLYNSAGTLLSAATIGGNTHTFNNLGSGTYRVKILTACPAVQSETTVNVGGAVSPAIEGVTNLCLGYGTQLSASGGTSYLWSNGSTSSSINLSPTAAGSYTYSVTVTNGTCSAVRSHTLTVNPSPSASISGPAGACYNGSIALSASGGGTYSWSTGASTASINVAALQNTQSFTVTVSNSYGCKRSESKTVTVYAPPSLDGTLSVCAGQAATLSVTGGSSYSWNTGETTASISPYPSSTSIYRVTVSDPNACTYVLSKTVSVSNLPDVRISGPNTTCAGQNVSLTAFGGSSYLWSTGANTATINVSPGSTTTYTVTVSSSGGCVGSASQVISVHPLPLGNIAGASSVCPGQSTTLSASGGSTYAWNTGASSAALEVSPTQNTNYTVSITNAQGCTLVKSHSVAVNITGSASNDGPLTCSKTSVNLQGSSGAQGATFQWKNAGGTLIASTSNATVTTAGTYTLEIIAAGGCHYSTSTQVLADLAAPVASASNNGPITCTLPAVTLSGSSSTSGSSFQWKNSSGTVLATTASAGVNQAGVYTLLTIGPNGCTSTSTTTVATDVVLPTLSTSNDGPLTCSKTTVTLSASGSGVDYIWKNSSSAIIASSTTVTVSTAGIYSVEARGSNGCKTIQPITVTQNGTLPNISANLVESADEGCTSAQYHFQGSSTTGGVGYEWRNSFDRLVSSAASFYTRIPGTYTLKVIAADGCSSTMSKTTSWPTTSVELRVDNNQVVNTQADYFYRSAELSCTKTTVVLNAQSWDNHTYVWSNQWGQALSTGNTYTVYQAGTYLLKSTDGNGCTETKEIRVTKNTSIPNLGIYGDSLVCEGSATVLSALGSGWGHVWNTGVSATSITTAGIYEPTTYSVTVNYGSCQSSLSRTVRVKGVRPTPGTAGPTAPCTGTPVSYSASGGTIYRWSTGETTALISVPAGFQNTNNVNYWVDVSNASGCTSRKSFTVRPKASPVAQLNGAPTAPLSGQGTVNLSASGGSTYLWSTGETTASLQKTLLASTNLSVRVSSSNGCSQTKGVDIVVNPLPQAQILGGEMACNGDNTTLSATGGSTYLWSTGATTSSIALTQATTTQTYSVTVSTQPGCSGVAQKTVIVPAALSLNYTLANVEDCTANNASVQPIVTGGQGNISLSIARYGELYFSPSLNGLRSGTYVLKAEDGQQCIALKEVVIEEKQPAPAIDLPDVAICAGATASLSINNAAAYTTFLWSNGATTSSITVSPTTITTYTITATASNGCQAMDQVVVRVNPILTAIAEGSGTFCLPFGSSANATLFASVNGGTAPYTYQWYSGQTTASISVSTPASAGFGVVVTDSKGCTASASASVIVIPLPQAQITGGEINCYGNSTTLTATGGQSYLWSTGATTASIIVTPSSSTYYSVTVSNGLCAAAPARKMVLVPEALSLSHQLENDDDCIVHNAVIVPSATGGQGDKIFKIARNGELYFSETLIGLASGNYILVAEDSVGCTVSQEVEIKETPVSIDSLTLQGVDDCVPGNTQLVIATTGDRLPLLYRLNGEVVSGPTITLPTAAGDYTIEVEDAAGCKATRNEYYPAYDVLTVNEYNINPVTDCSTPNGGIRLSLEGHSTSDYSSSVDGGSTWHSGDWVGNLRPGIYATAVRYGSSGCVIQGPSVQVSAPNCLPEAGFTKDTIMVRSTTQRIVLPWKVESRPWGAADKDFSLIVKREGDGTPHFVNPNIATLQSTELRSGSNTLGQVVGYARRFAGNDSLVLVLQPEAGDYLEPGIYTFTLEGENIEVDPFRNKLTVFVDLDGQLIITPIDECPGIEITLTADEGECWYWEGLDQDNQRIITINHQQGKIYTVHYLQNLVKKTQVFIGDDQIDIPVKLHGINEMCPGDSYYVSWQYKDNPFPNQESSIYASEWSVQWVPNPTSTPVENIPNSRRVSPTQTTTYKVLVTNIPTGCTFELAHTVVVDDLFDKVGIKAKENAKILCGGTEGVVLDIENPKNINLGYRWTSSNGFSSWDKPPLIVNVPGKYVLEIQWLGKSCTKTIEFDVKSNDPCEIKAYFESNGFYAIPIEIQNRPQVNTPELRVPCEDTGERVKDDAKLGFTIQNKEVGNLQTILKNSLETFEFYGYSGSKALISGNDQLCSCDNYLDVAEKRFKQSGLQYWSHVFEGEDCGGQDYLFIKAKMPNGTEYGSNGADFLSAGLNYALNVASEDKRGGKFAMKLVVEGMLDNYGEPKTPAMFSTAPPQKVPETTGLQANLFQPTCNDGKNYISANVVSASGQLIQLPPQTVWRFDINALIQGQIANGILAGYSVFADVGNFEAIQATYTFRFYVGTTNSLGYFQSGIHESALELKNGSQSFNVPPSDEDGFVDIETGTLIKQRYFNYADCGRSFTIDRMIFKPNIRAKLPGLTSIQPTGPFFNEDFSKLAVKNANNEVLFSIKPVYSYSICPDALGSDVADVGTDYSRLGVNFFYNSAESSLMYKIVDANGVSRWLYVRSTPGSTVDGCQNSYSYYIWNCKIAAWTQIDANDYRFASECESVQKLFEAFKDSEDLHEALGTIGFVPILGDIASLANGLIYLAEGDIGRGKTELFWAVVGIGGELIPIGGLGLKFINNVGDAISPGVARIIGIVKLVPCPEAPSLVENELLTPSCSVVVRILGADRTRALISKLQSIGFKFTDEAPTLMTNFIHNNRLGSQFHDWLKNVNVEHLAVILKTGLEDLKWPASKLEDLVEDLMRFPDLLEKMAQNADLIKAWDVLSASPAFRQNEVYLEQLANLIKTDGFDLAKLKSSFATAITKRNEQKWIDLKIPKADLEKIYQNGLDDLPNDYEPYSAQHKAQRWEQYKARHKEQGTTPDSYETWSNGFDGGIDRTVKANQAVDDYYNSNGWTDPPFKREYDEFKAGTINNFSSGRRFDIYDIVNKKAIEFKAYAEKTVYKTKDIELEVLKDAQLLKDGKINSLEWVFKGCEPSGPLDAFLRANGIIPTVIIP
ncbi:hypothetical protein [Haliscomenobacter hydrossis]|uniref:PKD domain containing protein n=1 Tax=Haliscomenobacter hydrossis (strain ATCC 27775 / DSM 1100 / LMG 10767 / O) TaxID=760192 RepID=F4KQ32_HALH1|nr:hypothetical protein [Haliscomenobacter hydrossis]AEE54193.1 PKD domain containing protein [Haliscomenobacter hydrossis DSM 1100]